jgi:DNA repair exonuclease SbcCD nuclease subunit
MKGWGADYFALGDIHRRWRVCDNCHYPGSLVQQRYEHEDGVMLVEIDDETVETKQLQLDLPKRIAVNVEFEEGKDTEGDVIELVKEYVKQGSLVRIQFELPVSIYAALDKIKMERELSKNYLEVKIKNDPVTEKRTRENTEKISKAKTTGEIIDILLEEDDYGLDRTKLKETCMKRAES